MLFNAPFIALCLSLMLGWPLEVWGCFSNGRVTQQLPFIKSTKMKIGALGKVNVANLQAPMPVFLWFQQSFRTTS